MDVGKQVRRSTLIGRNGASDLNPLEADMPDVIDPKEMRFRSMEDVMGQCHLTALSKGWWEGHDKLDADSNAKMLAEKTLLIVSEVTEAYAYEHYRNGRDVTDVFLDDGETLHMIEPTSPYEPGVGGKPDGYAVELADAIVRIFDLCARLDIPVLEALAIKMAYNATRPYRHGGKRV